MSNIIVRVGSQQTVVGAPAEQKLRLSPGYVNIVESPPTAREITLDQSRIAAAIEVGIPGPGGPLGPAGNFNGTTDGVPEGLNNLYFTDPRASSVAISAASASMSLHLADPDPHPQYVDANDTLDGGNF